MQLFILLVLVIVQCCFGQKLTVERYDQIMRHRIPLHGQLKQDVTRLDSLSECSVLSDSALLKDLLSMKAFSSSYVDYYGQEKTDYYNLISYCRERDYLKKYLNEYTKIEDDKKAFKRYSIPANIGVIIGMAGMGFGVLNLFATAMETGSEPLLLNPYYAGTCSALLLIGFPIIMVDRIYNLRLNYKKLDLIYYNNRHLILQRCNAAADKSGE